MPSRANADRALIEEIRTGLADLADPVKAPQMQAYMKSAMPFRGVQTPARIQLVRAVLTDHFPSERPTWEATVRALWDSAEYREERYAAIDLALDRRARRWQDSETLPLYDHVIATGAWWDYVDPVAAHGVGPILRADHESVVPVVRRWSRDGNMWRRRAAVIVQIGTKAATDTALLTDVIVANLGDREFFIRKAIGWALREYARTDPDWVRAFVAEHVEELSPLSRREATKHFSSP